MHALRADLLFPEQEGRVYLHHIINHYDDLADHTVFSQDIPDGNNLMGRTQVRDYFRARFGN